MLIHQLGFGKLIQQFLPEGEGPHWLKVTCPWLVNSKVKARSHHQGQLVALSHTLHLTREKNEVRMEVWVRAWSIILETLIQSLLPESTVSDSIYPQGKREKTPCQWSTFSLSQLFIDSFEAVVLTYFSHLKTHFGRQLRKTKSVCSVTVMDCHDQTQNIAVIQLPISWVKSSLGEKWSLLLTGPSLEAISGAWETPQKILLGMPE